MSGLFDTHNIGDLSSDYQKKIKPFAKKTEYVENILMLFEIAKKQHEMSSLNIKQVAVAYSRTFPTSKTPRVIGTQLYRMMKQGFLKKIHKSVPVRYEIKKEVA